jgi:small subunit ribosomal protein S9
VAKKKDNMVNDVLTEQPLDEQPLDEQPLGEQPLDEQPLDEQTLPAPSLGEQPGVERVYATGKRKTAVARVWLRRGKGRFSVNNMTLDEYFNRETHRMIVKQPMRLTKGLNDFDVITMVHGGGKSAQADAVKHGISKALVLFNTVENRSVLKKAGFLTRDSRAKERKKYGQRAARARFQFSKR